MNSNQIIYNKYKEYISILITSNQLKNLVLLFFILILGMILEVFGLGIIVPLISVLIDKNGLEKYQFYNEIEPFISNYSYNKIVVFLLVSMGLLYLIKTVVMIFLTYYQNKILIDLEVETSNRLFSKYIRQNYKFHLNNKSSSLIKNIQVEVGIFKGICNSIISLIIESFMILALVTTLLIINFKATLYSSILLSSLTYLFFYFSNNKISFLGIKREKYDAQFMNILIETFRGIKVFKIYSKENFIIKQFEDINFKRGILTLKYDFLSQIPRYLLEFIAIVGLISFLIFSILIEASSDKIIVTLGLFVAAIFKILPSTNKIINVLQVLKYSKPTINLLYNEFNLTVNSKDKSDNLIFNDSISLKNISFYFSDNEPPILNNITLSIKKGQMIGFYGESGSGKSTLVNILSGILNPTSGDFLVDEKRINNSNYSWTKRVGYVTQDSYLLNKSILENILLEDKEQIIDDDKLANSILRSNLKSFIEKSPKGLYTEVGEVGSNISGGEMQRISLARALYLHEDILILDEFTSSLDINTENDLMNEILKLKGLKTIIIVAHRLETLKHCDATYEIKHGKIVL